MMSVKKLFEHNGFSRYFANTTWLLGEKILRMMVGLFVGVWVARYLGPERFGLFSYAQSFVGLFTVVATLGLDGIVVRELVKDESRRNLLLGTAFRLKLIGALAVLLVLSLAVNFTSNDSQTNLLIIVIASATIFQSFNVLDFYFQSRVLSRYVAYANTITLFVSSVVKIALILNESPLIAFAWVVLFDSVILSLGFIYFYIKAGEHFLKWKFEKKVALSLLKDSWPLILSGVFISVYMKIDQVMIKEMLDAEAVGQYAAAVRLSEAWYFVPMVIAGSLFPAIINAKKYSKEIYHSRLQKLFGLIMWLGIAVALPMTFLSDWVVNLIYGGQYNQAGSVLMIHIWAGVAVSFGIVWSKWLLVENRQKVAMSFHLLAMIINITYNLYYIPKQGIMGAAIATALAGLTAQFIGLFCYERKAAIRFLLNSLWPMYLIETGKQKQ